MAEGIKDCLRSLEGCDGLAVESEIFDQHILDFVLLIIARKLELEGLASKHAYIIEGEIAVLTSPVLTACRVLVVVDNGKTDKPRRVVGIGVFVHLSIAALNGGGGDIFVKVNGDILKQHVVNVRIVHVHAIQRHVGGVNDLAIAENDIAYLLGLGPNRSTARSSQPARF